MERIGWKDTCEWEACRQPELKGSGAESEQVHKADERRGANGPRVVPVGLIEGSTQNLREHFPITRQGLQDRDIDGSRTDDERWWGYLSEFYCLRSLERSRCARSATKAAPGNNEGP